MMALKALEGLAYVEDSVEAGGEIYEDEPRKIQPKMTTKTVVRIRAFNGISSFGLTFAKNREAGSPPSL